MTDVKAISQNAGRLLQGEEVLPYMIEVDLKKDFLLVVETLTRIGVPGPDNKVTQTGHILRRDGKYYIAHATQLHALFNNRSRAPERSELARTVRVAKMLEAWGCLNIVNPVQCDITKGGLVVVHFDATDQYNLVTNFDFKKDA